MYGKRIPIAILEYQYDVFWGFSFQVQKGVVTTPLLNRVIDPY